MNRFKTPVLIKFITVSLLSIKTSASCWVYAPNPSKTFCNSLSVNIVPLLMKEFLEIANTHSIATTSFCCKRTIAATTLKKGCQTVLQPSEPGADSHQSRPEPTVSLHNLVGYGFPNDRPSHRNSNRTKYPNRSYTTNHNRDTLCKC